MYVCPKIISGKFEGNILSLQSENPLEDRLIFRDVLYFTVQQNFISLDWQNSGPSGPWGRYVSQDFAGIEKDGEYITDWKK